MTVSRARNQRGRLGHAQPRPAAVSAPRHLRRGTAGQARPRSAGIFESLRELGLEPELAARLRAAAGMRNVLVLVHDYLKVDDLAVWEALGRLDDLRQFSDFAESQLD